MSGWRRRLLGRDEPLTRLTREAAVAAAETAARAAGIDQRLEMTRVRRNGDRIEWLVGTATVGSGVTVVVDDATGIAGPVERWGVR